jgi:hypothetical protein
VLAKNILNIGEGTMNKYIKNFLLISAIFMSAVSTISAYAAIIDCHGFC